MVGSRLAYRYAYIGIYGSNVVDRWSAFIVPDITS